MATRVSMATKSTYRTKFNPRGLASHEIWACFYSHREGEAKGVPDLIDLQNDYVLELHKEAEHAFKNFFEYRNLMKKWIDDKVNKNLFTFRNQTFKSVVTGTQSTSNRIPFMENLDDSMEGIMNQC